jgi:hypothetical protein
MLYCCVECFLLFVVYILYVFVSFDMFHFHPFVTGCESVKYKCMYVCIYVHFYFHRRWIIVLDVTKHNA